MMEINGVILKINLEKDLKMLSFKFTINTDLVYGDIMSKCAETIMNVHKGRDLVELPNSGFKTWRKLKNETTI